MLLVINFVQENNSILHKNETKMDKFSPQKSSGNEAVVSKFVLLTNNEFNSHRVSNYYELVLIAKELRKNIFEAIIVL